VATINQQTDNTSTIRKDVNAPYSFYEWQRIYPETLPDREYELYKNYLTEWYIEKKKTVIDYKTQLRLNYITLLQQLQLFFSRTEAEKWYREVDFTDEKELLLAIPYFAKKLKDISLYYLKVREEVQKTKIKYNVVGTNLGIEKHLREIILNSFTKKTYQNITLPGDIWKNVPELSSVKDTLNIQIEELYDDQIYKDQDPNTSETTYFDLTAEQNTNYFDSKRLSLSANSWIYKSGSLPVSDTVLLDNINLADLLIEYYVGEDKYISSTATVAVSTNAELYFQPLQRGNNFFYWPTGIAQPSIESARKYDSILINDAGLKEVGTAGSTIEEADTVFIKTKNVLEGAWLRFKQYDVKTDDIVAYIDGNQKTAFRFPFPGYGLSADDIPWTGPSIKFTGEFNYLDKNNRASILNEYWTADFSLTSVEPVFLNETNLHSTGAYASQYYTMADKVRLFETTPNFNDQVFTSTINEAWLYKFTKTDIPIADNSDNFIIWPYGRFNPNDGYPNFLPRDIINICRPIPLTSILIPQGTFSNEIASADIIYKLPSITSPIEDAIECAWLSGQTYVETLTSSSNYGYGLIGTKQNGLNIFGEPGSYVIFKWEGPDNTNIENVFKTLKHQPDCPFTKLNTNTYLDSEKCNCRMVLYTPFGHPGPNYDSYGLLGDFIAEITNPFEKSVFDLKDWKDQYQTTYVTSSAFAWYKTTNKPQWGNGGQWVVTNTGKKDNFTLKHNHYYVYYRGYSPSQSLPAYILHHSYNDDTKTTWIKAIRDENNQWVTTNSYSDLILYPGDTIVYRKAPGTTYTTLTTTTVDEPKQENRGSIWTDYDYVSIVKNSFNQYPLVTVSYPAITYTNPDVQNIQDSYQQFPNIDVTRLYQQTPSLQNLNPTTILWILEDPTGNRFNYSGTTSFSFYPTVTGLYKVVFASITAASFSDTDLFLDIIRVTENRGSIWSNFDYASFNNANVSELPEFTVTYPQTNFTGIPALNNNDFYKQYPEFNFSKIVQSDSAWELTDPSNTTYTYYGRDFKFKPSLYGKYLVAVNAITAEDPNNIQYVTQTIPAVLDPNTGDVITPATTITQALTGLYRFTNIPPITATRVSSLTLTSVETSLLTGFYLFTNIPPITAVYDTTATTYTSSYTIPNPGFVLNTNLYGWNYNTGSIDSNTNFPGARPYWAIGFTDKNVVTNYKSIDSWGTPFRLVDGYNIITQPLISDLILQSDNYFEYERKYFTPFIWSQPINYRVEVNEKQWCTLSFNTTATSNLQSILNNLTNQLIADPTTAPSNLVFTNFIDNEPVEVHYYAISPFVWNITATPEIFRTELIEPEIIEKYQSKTPWKNLTNRYFPTIAIFPAFDKLYTKDDSGGFFTPNNLGTSLYVNKNFTTNLILTSQNLSGVFEDTNFRVGGRGLTKTDQPTPYTITDINNAWLKNAITTGPAAGTIKQDIIKKYQKFIPYQSSYETNINYFPGLVTPTSRQDPWDGPKDDKWGDTLNQPQSFTKVLNVSAWAEKQILKQFNRQLDTWCTDIYGNQYGLYKTLDDVNVYDRKNILGEIWTRKNSHFTGPAVITLNDVFDTYQNSYLINELTGIGIKHIDIFFDTLYIETTGTLLFEKIQYNYNDDKIFSTTDNSRYISLAIPVSTQLFRELTNTVSTTAFAVPGETWFMPNNKQVFITVCSLQNNVLLPELYKLDLNTINLTKEFPLNENDIISINQLSGLSATTVDRPSITYNSDDNEFVYVVKVNCNDSINILEMTIDGNAKPYSLKDITVYMSLTSSPLVAQLPYITHPLYIASPTNNLFTFQITANNFPHTYSFVPNSENWITINNQGLIVGLTPNAPGTYYSTFEVTNNDGSSYYSITVNVTST